MDVECICCGADLTALYPYPLPTVGAMCAQCRRAVQRLQAARRPLRPEASFDAREVRTSVQARRFRSPDPDGSDRSWVADRETGAHGQKSVDW